jgi:hypothetical protein
MINCKRNDLYSPFNFASGGYAMTWMYFKNMCCRASFLRYPDSDGWALSLCFCPLFFLAVRWHVDSYHQIGTLEKAIFISLLPGFPKLGSTVRLTWQHVFSRAPSSGVLGTMQ